MLWILLTVLVGLFVIVVQLLLAYQKRAARLKLAQNPVRKQIDDYKNKITEVGETTRNLGTESLVQLKKDLADFQRRSGQAANLNSELDSEAQAWVAEREGDDAEPDDDLYPELEKNDDDDAPEVDEDESDLDELLGGRKDPHMKVEGNRANPVDIVRAIRHELEETLEYMEGLRADANIVQQSLQWLGGEKKDKGGANGSA